VTDYINIKKQLRQHFHTHTQTQTTFCHLRFREPYLLSMPRQQNLFTSLPLYALYSVNTLLQQQP